MPIQPGDRIPEVRLDSPTPEGSRSLSTAEIFAGRRVVLFAVPGAFTPTCSDAHLPGFQVRAHAILSRGVDAIVCVVSNDAWVVRAWARARRVGDEILMLADGNGDLARALGLEADQRGLGLGVRSRRFAAIVDDGLIETLRVEPDVTGVTVSGAEAIVAALTLAGAPHLRDSAPDSP